MEGGGRRGRGHRGWVQPAGAAHRQEQMVGSIEVAGPARGKPRRMGRWRTWRVGKGVVGSVETGTSGQGEGSVEETCNAAVGRAPVLLLQLGRG